MDDVICQLRIHSSRFKFRLNHAALSAWKLFEDGWRHWTWAQHLLGRYRYHHHVLCVGRWGGSTLYKRVAAQRSNKDESNEFFTFITVDISHGTSVWWTATLHVDVMVETVEAWRRIWRRWAGWHQRRRTVFRGWSKEKGWHGAFKDW